MFCIIRSNPCRRSRLGAGLEPGKVLAVVKIMIHPVCRVGAVYEDSVSMSIVTYPDHVSEYLSYPYSNSTSCHIFGIS